jgi:hypothetical protein
LTHRKCDGAGRERMAPAKFDGARGSTNQARPSKRASPVISRKGRYKPACNSKDRAHLRAAY